MSPEMLGLIAVAAMIGLILLHVPIGAAMVVAGVSSFAVLRDAGSALSLLGTETVSALENSDVGVIPMFLLMGGFASASGLSADFYRLLNALVGHIRGGLAMATIGGCAGFGAVCGSSVATVAAMSRIALPEMTSRGYTPKLAAGSIAAGGTLGFLIPPSIIFVIYGFLTQTSILGLFLAALLPGVLAVALHFVAIAIYVRWFPDSATIGQKAGVGEVLHAARQAGGAFFLATIVMGGIYSGIFTVVESAAVGAAASFGFYAVRRRFAMRDLWNVLLEAGGNTAMIYLILIGASIFNYTITLSGLPEAVIAAIGRQAFSPVAVVVALLAIFIVIGCIFESIAAMVLTLPFVYPLVVQMGFDPLWWGVVNVMVIEIGMITPPVGLNVLVLHGMAKQIPLNQIFSGIVPFLLADLTRVFILVAFPVIATFLPHAFGH